ncbi:RNA-binding S4 domain-containing protein [Dendrosporobacter sp. 1207_IL3150]|uniref:RNA-binding S4 domain-containing protein n=1 Tax=Dendrosporobacter sp. 1207_IL3150 TaxID=3084054 RepID=UPI002FDAC1A8
MEEITINTTTINLDQLLKWAGIAETGGQVKIMIDEGIITLNNVTVTERRKKIHPGDIIEIEGLGKWQVTKE